MENERWRLGHVQLRPETATMSLDDGAAVRQPDTHAVENGASYQALGHILEALRASYLNERSVCCVRRSRPDSTTSMPASHRVLPCRRRDDDYGARSRGSIAVLR